VKVLIAFMALLALMSTASAQTHTDKDATVKQELQKLFSELNDAIAKKDRAALERVHADEFQFINATGNVVDKTAQINFIMSNDPAASAPVTVPSFENLIAYGDFVLLRTPTIETTRTSIYIKKSGRWQILQIQGTRLAPARRPITLDAKALDSFVGKYEFGPNAVTLVTREGDSLRWKAGARPKLTLVPLTENRFYAKENEAEMTFFKNERGQTIRVNLRLGNCTDSNARKVE
jgi:hypothetical protein